MPKQLALEYRTPKLRQVRSSKVSGVSPVCGITKSSAHAGLPRPAVSTGSAQSGRWLGLGTLTQRLCRARTLLTCRNSAVRVKENKMSAAGSPGLEPRCVQTSSGKPERRNHVPVNRSLTRATVWGLTPRRGSSANRVRCCWSSARA